jgi:hypothetical protein
MRLLLGLCLVGYTIILLVKNMLDRLYPILEQSRYFGRSPTFRSSTRPVNNFKLKYFHCDASGKIIFQSKSKRRSTITTLRISRLVVQDLVVYNLSRDRRLYSDSLFAKSRKEGWP